MNEQTLEEQWAIRLKEWGFITEQHELEIKVMLEPPPKMMNIELNLGLENESELDTFSTKLSSSQVPLDPDMEKILYDNLWDLYVTEEKKWKN